jgi:hypothetical protein
MKGKRVTLSDNKFFCYCPGVLEAFTFTATDHAITNPKDWGGVSSLLTDEGGKVIVEASRHGSPGVANWFRTEAGKGIPPDLPDDLNFAVKGNMTVKKRAGSKSVLATVRFENIIIAQGHIDPNNPWYVGGRNYRWDGAYLYGNGTILEGLSWAALERCKETGARLSMTRLNGTERYRFQTGFYLDEYWCF